MSNFLTYRAANPICCIFPIMIIIIYQSIKIKKTFIGKIIHVNVFFYIKVKYEHFNFKITVKRVN
jgi:hypothetical protein